MAEQLGAELDPSFDKSRPLHYLGADTNGLSHSRWGPHRPKMEYTPCSDPPTIHYCSLQEATSVLKQPCLVNIGLRSWLFENSNSKQWSECHDSTMVRPVINWQEFWGLEPCPLGEKEREEGPIAYIRHSAPTQYKIKTINFSVNFTQHNTKLWLGSSVVGWYKIKLPFLIASHFSNQLSNLKAENLSIDSKEEI